MAGQGAQKVVFAGERGWFAGQTLPSPSRWNTQKRRSAAQDLISSTGSLQDEGGYYWKVRKKRKITWEQLKKGLLGGTARV